MFNVYYDAGGNVVAYQQSDDTADDAPAPEGCRTLSFGAMPALFNQSGQVAATVDVSTGLLNPVPV